MRDITIKLTETAFNVHWRSLCDREEKLLDIIEDHDEESDEAVVANNDIVYLRAVKESLEKQAKAAGFTADAFSVDEEIIDLSDL